MNSKNEIRQFNLLQIILYHLLPGIPILFIAVICANPTWGFGLSIFLSLMIAIMFGLIPTQLIILKLAAHREGKKIQDILGFTGKIPISQTILVAIPLLVLAALVFTILPNIEHPLCTIFDWVPD